MMKKILYILFFFIPIILTAQTTYYIDPSGSDDTGDGSSGNPWKTLNYACDHVLGSGDKIHVNPGNYIESATCYLRVNVSLEGEGNNSCIISHLSSTTNPILLLSSGTNTSQSVSYLKFDGDGLIGYRAVNVYARDNVSIHHCTFEDFRWFGVSFSGAGSNDNNFHDNVINNCSGGISYGFGDEGMALRITQQTDFLCYNNIFNQSTRGGGYDGVGIGGFETTYGTKIYNNDIYWVPRNNTYWCFAIELWYAQGMEMYGNTIQGEIDMGKDINYGGYSYGLYFHDNIVGWDTPLSASNEGLQCEQTVQGLIVCNNIFKNLDNGIHLCQYKYSDDFVEDIWIYSNLIYNVGRTVSNSYGWGIRFECGSNADDEYPPQYYDNINIWNNTIVAYSTYPAQNGIELPAHATVTSTMDIDIKNNIIIGFGTAGIRGRQWDNDYSPAIDGLVIQDNILYGNGYSNNAYFTFTPTNYTNDGGIKSDPLFVNSPTDLHLSSTSSPAYHAGTDVTPPYDLGDYDGVTWATPYPSIGAYEYVAGGQTIWYIDPAGSDETGNGSASYPWKTLAYACSQVTTSGHTIHVNAGTYNETTNRANLTVGVSIVGEGETSIITYTYAPSSANDAAIYLHTITGPVSGNQSISYIKIDGNSYTATRAICVNYRSDVLIHHCTITGFNYSGITFDSSNDVYPNPPTSTYATGNKVYDCTFVDCTNRANESGQIRAMGQDGLLVYNNTFDADNRATGYNGNCITTNWNRKLKIYDNDFYRPSDEGTGWNFFFEYWHCQGEDEVYGNIFNGGGVLDFVNVDKETYQWGIKIYDNDFLISSQIAKGYRTIQAIDFEERGGYESVYIYNNYFKNYPNCIQLLATMNEEDVYIDDIFIYCNIMEDVGYSDYTSSFGIFVNGEQTSYDYYADNINIWNNTILNGSGTSNEGIRWQVCGETTDIKIRNNIIQGFNNYPIRFAYQLAGGYVDGISVENNLYYNNGTDAANYSGATIYNKTEQNNNVGNPNFVSSSDFHLTSSSTLAIDEGINVGLYYDYDYELWGSPPSIGAYEYITGGPPPGGTAYGRRVGKYVMKHGKLIRR